MIRKSHTEDLATTLKKSKFSVIIDESTDIGASKNLSVCVRFFDEESKAIVTRLWKLVNVFDGKDSDAAIEEATARRLLECLVNSFEKENVPMEKVLVVMAATLCSEEKMEWLPESENCCLVSF